MDTRYRGLHSCCDKLIQEPDGWLFAALHRSFASAAVAKTRPAGVLNEKCVDM